MNSEFFANLNLNKKIFNNILFSLFIILENFFFKKNFDYSSCYLTTTGIMMIYCAKGGYVRVVVGYKIIILSHKVHKC